MMTSKDVAQHLHISEQTVRAYARDGMIPFAETPGGHRRYVLDDVTAALARARKRKLDALEDGTQTPRVSSEAPASEMRRARRSRPGITQGARGEARDAQAASEPAIPFIGRPGSSRFVVGQVAHV